MGLEQLKTALDEGAALTPMTPDEVAFRKEKLSDLKALGIVLQDVSTAEKYLSSKALALDWNTADELYRALVPAQNWDGSDKKRANLGMPLVMEVVETLMPQVHLAFFSDKQPFLLDAKGRTTPACARATEKVLCWAIKMAEFVEEIRKVLKNCLLYGNGVGKWGWRQETITTKKYARSEDGVINSQPVEKTVTYPFFESIELGNILVDPSLRSHDIRKARYVIHQNFVTADELDEMRDDPTYKNIPTRAELRVVLTDDREATEDSMAASKVETFRQNQAELQRYTTSSDPTKQPLELLEYVNEDRIITVLQRKIIIRNDENEFGKINFNSCAFIDVPKAFHGFGIAKLLEGEQRFEQGTVNAWIDSLSLYLTPAWHRKNGVGDRAQSIAISPGKVVNDSGDLEPLHKESVSAEALGAIQVSEARARRRVGANIGAEMPNQAMRTAEGVQEFTSSLQIRLQYFVQNFATNVFIPVLEAFIEMAKENMSPKQINSILTEEQGRDFEGDILDVYNGQYGLDVLTSTKLAARRAMAQMVPMLTQLFSSEGMQDSLALQGKKVNYAELFDQMLDLAGWDADNIFVDMTDEDKQRLQQNNPAVVKAQADQQKQATQQQNATELEASKADGRAGVQIVRHILKQQESTPMATALKGAQPEEPQPPSRSISFKDLPPAGKVQLAAQAGITLHPSDTEPLAVKPPEGKK